MPSTQPVIVVDVVADFPAALGDYNRSQGFGNDNEPSTYQRTWKYGSALYQLVWDYNGDTVNGGDPYYYKRAWTMAKSTDGGATWAKQDESNRPMGGNYGTSAYYEACVQIGSKIWVFYDYGEHPEVSPGVYGYQFDEIRVRAFDCTTDTWTAETTGGPIRALTSVSSNFTNGIAVDACYIGGDEIVVFHRETDYTASPKRSLYSIFNTSSLSWSSVDTVVFTSATAADVEPGNCCYDGTRTHFFAFAGGYASATGEKWHRTRDSGGTLNTVTNMFASWPGGWRALTADFQAYNGHVRVFGGEVIYVMAVELWAPTGAPTRQWKVIAMRCTAGTAVPTWSLADISSTDWDTLYAGWGQSGTPFLVEHGGDLYCLAGGFGTFTAPSNNLYSVFSQKYLGSGSWDAPVEMWSEFDAYGSGYGGPYQQNEILKVSGIGDLSGTDLNSQIAWAGTLSWAPDNKDTVRFWRYIVSTCCCADTATAY